MLYRLYFTKGRKVDMKKTGLIAVLAAGAIMFSGCAGGNSKKVAMTIGDTQVTLGEINVLAGSLTSYYGFDEARDTMADQIESTLKYGAVGKAMELELDEDAQSQVKQMTAYYAQQAGGLKAYKKFLAKCGTSVDFLNNLFEASAYQALVTEKIQEELGDAEPSDDDLKAYFKDNYYRAKHILIEKEAPEETEEDTAEDTADEAEATETAEAAETEEPTVEPLYGEESANALLERAKGGEDFDEMISKYSTDPGSESNPDGYIFTEGDMVEPFYEGVKSIEPGEFTIAESDYGYHIIERLSLSEDDGKFNEWFEENKDAVKSAYEQKQLEDKLDEYCEQYGITVERDDETIAKLTEDNAVVMPTPIPTSSDDTASN